MDKQTRLQFGSLILALKEHYFGKYTTQCIIHWTKRQIDNPKLKFRGCVRHGLNAVLFGKREKIEEILKTFDEAEQKYTDEQKLDSLKDFDI